MLAGYRLAFALLVSVAVCVQLVHGIREVDNFSVVNFFSFFTIDSNIFGAVIFIVSALALENTKRRRKFDYLRGAATLYMVITGIVYIVALSGADVQTPVPWVNTILHYVFPAGILVDWLIDRPARLSLKKSLLWLIFPLVYLAYTLIHGPLAHHWYPYPFVDVTRHGYAVVALNSAAIAVFTVLLALALASIPRFRRVKK